MIITNHAAERMKERGGIDKKSLDRIAGKVFSNGLKHSELHGGLKRWADGLYLSHRIANQMRLHGDKMFLFHNKKLITVIQLPNKYKNTVKALKNKTGGDINS